MTTNKEVGLHAPKSELEAFCRKWEVSELSMFGSALRNDFGPESDVDILVAFGAGARHGLFDLVRMRDELEDIFGRGVDLVSRRAIEASSNHIRREAILGTARAIYGPAG